MNMIFLKNCFNLLLQFAITMKIKKSKTKIIVLSVCSVLAIIGFLAYRVELYHRTNEPNKERIFEIEDCARNRKLKLYDYET